MRELPVSKLLSEYQLANPRRGPEVAMIDDEFISASWSHHYSRSPKNMKIMIGDTNHESDVVKLVAMKTPKPKDATPPQTLFDSLSIVMPFNKVAEVLNLYNITADSLPEQVKEGLLMLCEDLMFKYPSHECEKMFSRAGITMYRYVFDQANPFGGPFKGDANHALDLIYLYGNSITFSGVENEEQERIISKNFQLRVLEFLYHENPWKPHSTFAFGPHGKFGEIEQHEMASRRRIHHFLILDTFTLDERVKTLSICKAYLTQMK
jgi:carboxylesterase type B